MSRPALTVRAACLTLLSGFLAGAAARAAGAPAAKAPAWPAHVRLIEARLAAEAYASFAVTLPQFRLYDSQGRRLADSTGYSRGFARLLGSLLSGKGAPDGGHLLIDDLNRFETPAGGRLAEVPAADFTVVEYWAEWCLPCHKQSGDLARVLAKHPKLAVNVVYVHAAPPGGDTRKSAVPRTQ